MKNGSSILDISENTEMTCLGRFTLAFLFIFSTATGCEFLGCTPHCENRCSEILLHRYSLDCPRITSSLSGEYVLALPGHVTTVEHLFDTGNSYAGHDNWLPEDFNCSALESAVFDDGRFVLVCERNYEDGRGTNIYAQLFHPEGDTAGELLQVNEQVLRNHQIQDVTVTDNAHFVVVWKSLTPQGREPKIHVKIYDSDGIESGEEFLSDPQGTFDQTSGRIAGFEDGSFVIAWTEIVGDCPSCPFSIKTQRYDPEGNARGEIITLVENSDLSPSVTLAGFRDKRFLMVYTTGDYNVGHAFSGQVFDVDGNKDGMEFTVIQSVTDWYKPAPSVSTFADGSFVVSWKEEKTDNSETALFAQRFDSQMTPKGNKIHVNQCRIPDYGDCNDVQTLPDNSFLVLWSGMYQWELCGFDDGVFAQHFNSSGERVYKDLHDY